MAQDTSITAKSRAVSANWGESNMILSDRCPSWWNAALHQGARFRGTGISCLGFAACALLAVAPITASALSTEISGTGSAAIVVTAVEGSELALPDGQSETRTGVPVGTIPLFQFRYIGLGEGILVAMAALSLAMWLLIRLGGDRVPDGLKGRIHRIRWLIMETLFLTIVTVVAFVGLHRLERQTRDSVGEMLHVVVQTTKGGLCSWFTGTKSQIEMIASEPHVVELVGQMVCSSASADPPAENQALAALRRHLQRIGERHFNEGFFIITPDFTSVGSMRDSNLGLRNLIAEHRPDLLRRAFLGETVFIPPIRSDVPLSREGEQEQAERPTMFVGTPVRDSNGHIIAVMTLRYDPNEYFSGVARGGRAGKTGETYMFDASGKLLSESRFTTDLIAAGILGDPSESGLGLRLSDPGGNLTDGHHPCVPRGKQPLTLAVREAVAGRAGLNVDGYRDYRGVRVLGAWVWDDELGIGMVTEIDEREGLAGYRGNRAVALSVLGLVVLLTSALVGFLIVSGDRYSRVLRKARDEWERVAGERNRRLIDSQHELAEREANFRGLFEGTRDAVLLGDESGFLACNGRALEMYGYSSREQLLGMNPGDVSPPTQPDGRSSIETSREIMARALSGKSARFEWVHKRADGEEFATEVLLSPVTWEGRKAVQAVIRNITERKQAETEQQQRAAALAEANAALDKSRLEALRMMQDSDKQRQRVEETLKELKESEAYNRMLFENFPIGLALCRTSGEFVDVNRVYAQIIGRSIEETLKLSYWDITPEDYVEQEQQHLASLKATGRYGPYEKEHIHKDGHRVPVRLSGLILSRRDEEYIWSTVEDVTEERRVAREIQNAKEAAEAASLAKSEFVANVSHEIRTPLNAITGMGYLLGRTSLTKRQRDYLAKLHSASDTLMAVINDVLDFSKIESRRLVLEEHSFRVDDILESVASVTALAAQAKGLEFFFNFGSDMPMTVIGDSVRIRQVLLNLTYNAIKFTEKGSVVISCAAKECDTERATMTFAVQDTGIGMSDEQQAKVFRPFAQGDASTTRTHGGTGLGLTISRHLVELMGGRMTVDSKEKHGSTFTFDIPVRLPKAETKGVALTLSPPGTRVLLVEDSQRQCDAVSLMLNGLGMQVDSVDSGEAALQKLTAGSPYALILSDVVLGGISGFTMAEKLMEIVGEENAPPIVFMTGHEETKIAGLAPGRDTEGILFKPFTRSELQRKLNSVLGTTGETAEGNVAQSAAAELGGATVLLVEDNEINRQVATELLESESVIVETVSCGEAALPAVRAQRFDAILMDIQMPGMDGYETARRIRALPAHSDVPILAMTANVQSDVSKNVREAGMNDLLSKPVEPQQLYAVLAKWVQAKGTGGSLNAPEKKRESPRITETGIPDISGIDTGDGLRRTGGKPAFYVDLLRKFARDTRGTVERMASAWREGRRAEAQRIVHTLRGQAGSLGAHMLAEAATQVDAALAGSADESVEDLLARLHEVLAQQITDIETALAPESAHILAPSGRALDREAVREIVRELHKLLSDDDARATECVGRLSTAVAGTPLQPHVEAVERAIGVYDYPDALEALSAVRINVGKGNV